MGTINFTGNGGILEGDLGSHDVNINLDKALYFSGDTSDSVSDHVTFGTAAGDRGTSSTGVSVWIRPEKWSEAAYTAGGYPCIFGKQANVNTNQQGWGLYLSPDNEIFWNYGDGTYGGRINTPVGVVKYGEWFHIAAGYNSSTKAMTIHVNGKEQASGTAHASTGNTSSSHHLRLGANGSDPDEGDAHYKGYIADARLFGYAISEANAKKFASAINVVDPLNDDNYNMNVWYKCNDGSGHTIVDHHDAGTDYDGSFKRNDANYSTDIWHSDVFSVEVQDRDPDTANTHTKIGGDLHIISGVLDCKTLSSYKFDGSNDRIYTNSAYDLRTGAPSYSVSMWMNPNSVSGFSVASQIMFQDQKFQIKQSNTNLQFWPNYGTEFQYADAFPQADRWYHIALAFDDSDNSVKIWVDGVLGGSGTDSTSNTTGGNKIYIGTKDDNTNDWQGCIRDIKIWEHALDTAQVASLHAGTNPACPQHQWLCQDRADEYTSTNVAHSYIHNSGTKALFDTGCLIKDPADNATGWGNDKIGNPIIDGTNHLTVLEAGDVFTQRIDRNATDGEMGANCFAFYEGDRDRNCVSSITDLTGSARIVCHDRTGEFHDKTGNASFAWKLMHEESNTYGSVLPWIDNNKVLKIIDLRVDGATESHGEFELGGAFRIGATGTMSAPKGCFRHWTTQATGNYYDEDNSHFGINRTGNFIHNKGKWLAKTNGNYSFGSDDNDADVNNRITFWDFELYSKSTGGASGNTWARCPLSVTFESSLSKAAAADYDGDGSSSGSYVVFQDYKQGNNHGLDHKFGTFYQSGVNDVNYYYSHTSAFTLSKMGGVSPDYPAIFNAGNMARTGVNSAQNTFPETVELYNIIFRGSNIVNSQFGTVDYSSTPRTWKLTGDVGFGGDINFNAGKMDFNNANITVDLNGNMLYNDNGRLLFSASPLKDVNGGLIKSNNLNLAAVTSTMASTAGDRANLILNNKSGSALSNMFYSGSGAYWDNVFIQGGQFLTYAGSGSSTREERTIVGGRYDIDHEFAAKDFVVPAGGHVIQNHDMHIAGDAYFAGGLTHKMCWDLNGNEWASFFDINVNNTDGSGNLESSSLYSNQVDYGEFNNSQTYMMWCRTPDGTTTKQGLASKYHTNGFFGMKLYMESGKFGAKIGIYSGNERDKFQFELKSENTFNDGLWHHVAMVMDVPVGASGDSLQGTTTTTDKYYSTFRLLVDGQVEDIYYARLANEMWTQESRGNLFGPNQYAGISIGTASYRHDLEIYQVSSAWLGQIADFQAHGKALSDHDIRKYMFNPPAAGTTAFVHHYKLDEGSQMYATYAAGTATIGTNFGQDSSGHTHARPIGTLNTSDGGVQTIGNSVGDASPILLTTDNDPRIDHENSGNEYTRHIHFTGGTSGSKKNIYYINGHNIPNKLQSIDISGHYNLVGISKGTDILVPSKGVRITGGIYDGANHSGVTGAVLYFEDANMQFQDLSGVINCKNIEFAAGQTYVLPSFSTAGGNTKITNYGVLEASGTWTVTGGDGRIDNKTGATLDFKTESGAFGLLMNYALLKVNGGTITVHTRIDGATTSSYETINNCTIKSPSSGYWIRVAAEADWQLIGKLQGFLVKNHGFGSGGSSQITVLGPVVNCTIDKTQTHPNRILQHHFTQDSKQALDLDAIDDRDILLEDPTLDNAGELVGFNNG